ncbi:MAG: hypothetical protein K9M55_06770 [Candidatus Marinimicrobia bacterium]|nr:hypothetical protein [Candidatus Neomarinimicrobiota bacterium]MCF7922387.1 hypothetical protein [Candidatus Neomarinimicrobiota bacterium]
MNEFRKGDPLAHEPFSYQQTKEGHVQIFYDGRLAKTIKGKEADRFIFKITGVGERASQLFMAKVTGKIKIGNEKPRRPSKFDE